MKKIEKIQINFFEVEHFDRCICVWVRRYVYMWLNLTLLYYSSNVVMFKSNNRSKSKFLGVNLNEQNVLPI